jgi:hypothetical protein
LTNDIEHRYQQAAEYATEDGVAKLLAAKALAKEAVTASEAKIADCKNVELQLKADQIARNNQCVATAKMLREAEVTLYDALLDAPEEEVIKLTQGHENRRLTANAATGAYRRLVEIRIPRAHLLTMAAQVAHQEAVADAADAYAAYCLARKLLLLAPLLAVEGDLTVTGGLSELAYQDAILERGKHAESAATLREYQGRFDAQHAQIAQ